MCNPLRAFADAALTHLLCQRCSQAKCSALHAATTQILQAAAVGGGIAAKVRMRPVITSIHCDFAMRVHTCQWAAMSGLHPGGWCLCAHRGIIVIQMRGLDGRMQEV